MMVCESETADGLNEMQFLSLTAGGAYGTVIQRFLSYCSKHSSAAHISTHLNALYGGKVKRKWHVNFSEIIMNLVPHVMVFSPLCVPSLASLASVNGRLQTHHNNNIICPHTFIAVQFVCTEQKML